MIEFAFEIILYSNSPRNLRWQGWHVGLIFKFLHVGRQALPIWQGLRLYETDFNHVMAPISTENPKHCQTWDIPMTSGAGRAVPFYLSPRDPLLDDADLLRVVVHGVGDLPGGGLGGGVVRRRCHVERRRDWLRHAALLLLRRFAHDLLCDGEALVRPRSGGLNLIMCLCDIVIY